MRKAITATMVAGAFTLGGFSLDGFSLPTASAQEYCVKATLIQQMADQYGVGRQARIELEALGLDCVPYETLLQAAANLQLNLRPYGLPYDFSQPVTVATAPPPVPVVQQPREIKSTPTALPATGTSSMLAKIGTLLMGFGVGAIFIGKRRRSV